MSSNLNIFFTGGTGLIGGSVLSRLLKHPQASNFHITALVRTNEKAEKIRTLGIEPIVGSYSDNDLTFLVDASAKADVVIAAADSDMYPAAKAILDGMKMKYEKSGKAPILIHTSGTALFCDDARGMPSEHIVYSDLDVDKLNALPITVFHRNVDIPIIEADKAGFIKAYLIIPSTIFGYPEGPLVDLGIQNIHSVQIPFSVKASIARKKGSYFGTGLYKWPAVDVGDTADLYIILLDIVLKNPDAIGHGPDGFYIAENCEYSGLDVARAISDSLVELRVAEPHEPSAYTPEELDRIGPIWTGFAHNCYARADRSRSIGWKPKKGKEAFLANVKAEVKQYLAEMSSA